MIVIAGDPLARAGLAALLSQGGCAVVGQVAGDADSLTQVALYHPEVVLWDLGWDPTVELETGLELLSACSDAGWPVVALLPDETHVAEVWTTGVNGVLRRGVDSEALIAALEATVRGLLVLDPGLVDPPLPSRQPTRELMVEELTPREIEVLQLLADGLTNRAIAQRLGISDHTVKFHVNAIFGKLGAQSRTDAAVRATRLGLILL